MPISNGNASLSFTVGGQNYVLPYVNISSWDQRPVYAEDGFTLIRYETTITGTTVISDGTSTFTLLNNQIKRVPGKVDHAQITVTSSGGTQTLYEADAPDALNGPLMSMTITEITGRRAAIATFTLFSATTNANAQGDAILSHRWVQSFALDAVGRVTRTVTGTLIVNLANTNNSTAYAEDSSDTGGKAPWADLFRKAVMPLTAFGTWRRESQTFAYNETGNGLIYSFTDVQAKTNLPDGAYTGNCEFTYERSIDDLAWATLKFSCDLESTTGGDVRHLIWAAVVLSTSRIDYGQCKIVRMSVQELEMLGRSKIRFDMTAACPAIGQDPESGVFGVVPLANRIGKYFTVSRSTLWHTSPYGGDANGFLGKPHWSDNTVSAKDNAFGSLPVAEMIVAITDYVAPGTPTISLSTPDTMFDQANSEMQGGPYASIPQLSFNASLKPTTVDKAQTVTNVSTDTRMHRLQTLYTQGSDFVFQAGKASVVLEEMTTIKRTNEPPMRFMRPIPPGFVVVKDDWKVNFGEIDPSGHRTFIGVYTRTLQSYDNGGGTSNGYTTVGGRRQWWSPTALVTSPLALGFDPSANGQNYGTHVFGVTGGQSYNLGPAQDYA